MNKEVYEHARELRDSISNIEEFEKRLFHQDEELIINPYKVMELSITNANGNKDIAMTISPELKSRIIDTISNYKKELERKFEEL